MKIAKIALISAVTSIGLAGLRANQPALDYHSYGWFTTSGYYPIEYWVTADEPAGTLQTLSVDAYYESGSVWENTQGTGNGYHLEANGWCNTVDGYTPGYINGLDGGEAYTWDGGVEFSF